MKPTPDGKEYAMNAIECRDLTKSYQGFTLDHITFTLPAGCILGLVGENGAGKSTTLKLLMNATSRADGQVSLLGTDNQSPDFLQTKQDIGVVLDEACLPEVITPLELGKLMSLTYTRWDQPLYESYLTRFDIPRTKQFKDFSRGMKMKLSIATALAHRPKLLILDEATSGLDPVMRDDILDIFLDYIQDENHSILMSSHITTDLEKIADYVTFIHEGKIVFSKTKDELIYNYGILRCSKDDFDRINPGDILAYRKEDYQWNVLVADRDKAMARYRNVIVDHPTIDDILLLYVKGEAAK